MHDLERYGLTIDDLPEWLRPRPTRFDYALLTVILLCLVVSWPWLRNSGIPNSMGAWESIFRISEMTENLQSGDLYPRWASHYHYSYGSPVFNYLAPAPHYLGGLHYLLTQSSPRLSLKLLIVASILMAGTGMFCFGRRRWGTLAGFCAALVYLLAPPLLLTLPYITVDLPLLLAAGTFPCLFWSLDRVLTYGNGRDIAILSLLTGLQITTHTTIGPLFLGMAFLWMLWMAWIEKNNFLRAFSGIATGMGIAAIYWLPAFWERDEIHWLVTENIRRPLRLSEVLGLLPAQDFLVFNPDAPASLGLATWGLFLLGGLACLAELILPSSRKKALPALPFIILAPVLLWIATNYKNEWLDSLSKFPALSRPDLLVPVTACCALVAGQCARAIDQYVPAIPLKVPALMLLVSAVLGSSFYVIQPPPFVPYRLGDGKAAHLEAELRGAFSGSFRYGQMLPKNLAALPEPSDYLLDSYERGTVEKLSRNSQVVRAGLAIFSHSPTKDSIRLTSVENDSRIEFLTLYFPGWKAEFRGRPVPIESPNGFIEVILPEGRGVLNVFFSLTPARTVGTILTLAGGLLTLLFIFRKKPTAAVVEDRPTMLLTVGLGLLAVIGISAAREVMPIRSSLETMTPLPLVFEGGIDLLGYNSETTLLQPGQTIPITFYWERARPNLPNYRFDVWLMEQSTQQILWQETHHAAGGWPTSYWQENRYVQDKYWVVVPENVPPGTYEIWVQVTCQNRASLFTCAENAPLQVFDARGRPLGDSAVLPIKLTVR